MIRKKKPSSKSYDIGYGKPPKKYPIPEGRKRQSLGEAQESVGARSQGAAAERTQQDSDDPQWQAPEGNEQGCSRHRPAG